MSIESLYANVTNLQTLHLDHNTIENDNILQQEIKKLTNLIDLKLDNNNFKGRMKRELKDLIHLGTHYIFI